MSYQQHAIRRPTVYGGVKWDHAVKGKAFRFNEMDLMLSEAELDECDARIKASLGNPYTLYWVYERGTSIHDRINVARFHNKELLMLFKLSRDVSHVVAVNNTLAMFVDAQARRQWTNKLYKEVTDLSGLSDKKIISVLCK